MLNKIYDNYDIFLYIIQFLDLQSKIILEKIYKKKIIKSFDFSYTKNFNSIKCICNRCYSNLIFEQNLILEKKYNKYNNELYENLKYKPNNFFYKEQINFLKNSYYFVAIRAFLEIIEKYQIYIDLYNTQCIFEINIKNSFYIELYNNINDSYDNATKNNKLNYICKRCGLFGHNDETKECILYNKKYHNYIVKKKTKEMLNNMINILVINEEKEKKYFKDKVRYINKK